MSSTYSSAPPPFSVIFVSNPAEMDRSLKIRKTVFCDEQGYDPAIEVDEKDAGSDHLLLVRTAEDGTEEDVGTVRWYSPLSKLGRFAVLKPYRGTGAGGILGGALEEHIRERRGGAKKQFEGKDEGEIVANSQMIALGYYLKKGWKTEGEEFLEEGQPHIKVVKKIQLKPE